MNFKWDERVTTKKKMLSDTSESERESGKEVENLPREICQAPIFI